MILKTIIKELMPSKKNKRILLLLIVNKAPAQEKSSRKRQENERRVETRRRVTIAVVKATKICEHSKILISMKNTECGFND